MPGGQGRDGPPPREPLAVPDFRSYWAADAVGALGLAFTPVVVDVLVVQVLQASEAEVGMVRGAPPAKARAASSAAAGRSSSGRARRKMPCTGSAHATA